MILHLQCCTQGSLIGLARRRLDCKHSHRMDTTLTQTTYSAADCRSLVLDQVVDIGLQLSAGLNFLHQRGCMHGDLKPNNIGVSIVGGRLVAKLLDAGSFRQFPPGGVGSLSWGVPGQMP